jgi:hypothetical protein
MSSEEEENAAQMRKTAIIAQHLSSPPLAEKSPVVSDRTLADARSIDLSGREVAHDRFGEHDFGKWTEEPVQESMK